MQHQRVEDLIYSRNFSMAHACQSPKLSYENLACQKEYFLQNLKLF